MFDLVVVAARKPEFFTTRSPFFEIATEEGLLRPAHGALKSGTSYFGGSARELEKHLGVSGDEILYVGDHMFGDVHVTKNVLRWRTALILRGEEALPSSFGPRRGRVDLDVALCRQGFNRLFSGS